MFAGKVLLTKSGPASCEKIAMSDAEARIRAGGKSFRDHLAVEPIVQINGVVAVPGGPGPGIEIDRAVIERYRVL
jgi:L-alanine-DL-glutamate epimerase-like enolase superfamily enzyme